MTKKVADIKAKVGEYQKGGETKGRWIDVGYVLETDKGGKMRCYYPWINLAGIPKKDGYDTVTLSEFDVKDDKKPQQSIQQQSQNSEMSDECPF